MFELSHYSAMPTESVGSNIGVHIDKEDFDNNTDESAVLKPVTVTNDNAELNVSLVLFCFVC